MRSSTRSTDLNADGAMRKHLAGVLVKRTLAPLATG